MQKKEQSSQRERKECERKHSMTPAPAPLEIGGRPTEIGDRVDIGEIGPDDQCRGAECGSPSQSAAGEGGSYQCVADRVYSSLASMSS